jgi:phosphatidylglycerol:prolipoprotein diacylglycerol transferase
MDVLAPALALGQSIWYGGCFLTGYRYDRLSGFPWTMVFEDPHTAMIWGVPLHSDQLLTAAVSLGLFAFVWRKRKGKRFDGELFWLYILLDSLSRVLSTHLQADVHDGLTARAFLVSQIMGGILIATAVFMLTTLKRRPLQRCSQAAGEHAQECECKPEQAPDDQEK